jgi:hypothetical protein
VLAGNYVTQPGDTLAALALRFRTEPAVITARNPGLAALGPALEQTLPPGTPLDMPLEALPAEAWAVLLVPDSEVVYAPGAAAFDVRGYVLSQPGFLAGYAETLQAGQAPLAGWEIVALYARRYSVHPRLLLALLEMQSGALSNPAPEPYFREHPLGADSPAMLPGLSHQLGWAGSQLNYGYYAWRAGSQLSFPTADGPWRQADVRLNAGTFAVSRLLGLLYRSAAFPEAAARFAAVYQELFGNPFFLAVEPLLPGGLAQPAMQLPFEPGRTWTFTGGPHAPYGRTLPWAALDFAPPAEQPGCAASPEWVTAVAAGTVTYSHEGLLELDLGDGWTVVYLHLATLDRAPAGTVAAAGQRLGHPSCEGGRSTGSHVHLSRKYNGEWMAADGFAPFVLSGWRARNGTTTYLGTLTRGDRVLEACACAKAEQRIALD